MQIKSKEIGKKHFDVFNLAEIDTTIETVETAFKGTKIRLSDGRQFVFFPFTDEILNNSSIFNFTAQEGDRLKKRIGADTLYLIKADRTLLYTFKKFK